MKLLNIADVCKMTTLSKSTIKRLVALEKFPKPVKITEKRLAWSEESVTEWIDKMYKNKAKDIK